MIRTNDANSARSVVECTAVIGTPCTHTQGVERGAAMLLLSGRNEGKHRGHSRVR